MTKKMTLDFLMNIFSEWMLGSLDFKESAVKSHGRCLSREGTLYDFDFRSMIWKKHPEEKADANGGKEI